MQGKTVLITGANSGIGFVKPVTKNAEVATRLWRISAGLVGLPVDLQPTARPQTATESASRSVA
jgi:hypothetical protein